MTIEEKLEHFYDVSVKEAEKEAQQQLEKHQEHLEQILCEHKEIKQKEAELAVKTEAENARHEINKALSAEQLTIKRNWTQKQNELKSRLFSEVQEHLDAFMATPAYDEFLCQKILEAREFAQDDKIQIYVGLPDAHKVKFLEEKTGLPIQVAQKSFRGGMKAVIPEKNILIDNSFSSAFEALKKEFTFEGGLKHE